MRRRLYIYFRLAEISVGQLFWQPGGWCFSDASQIAKLLRTITVTTSFARVLSLTLPALQSGLWLRSQPEFGQPADGLRPARQIIFLAAPFVQPLEQVFDDSDTRKRKTGIAATL
jgi:hypothetical protein